MRTADGRIAAYGAAMSRAVVELSRAQVFAHRVLAQQLHRPAGVGPADLSVWDLGVQDTPAGSAALALANRLPGGADDVPDLVDPSHWTSVWATRGAPVVLPTGEVDHFARALWPIDEGDAVARLAGNGQHLRKAGADPFDALRVTASALRKVVRATMTKGEASTKVTRTLPDTCVTWCRPCDTHHVGEQLMRLAALPAGIEDLIDAYLRLHGPATPTEAAGFLGTSARPVKAIWPDGLAEVTVEGRRAWLPAADLDDVAGLDGTEGGDVVRLLPAAIRACSSATAT